MYQLCKRGLDIIVSLVTIILLLPFLIPIVILLKLTDEGEIFYRQTRVGYKNERFKILKFATMLKNSPNMGSGDVTLRNDPRVTKIGKYLRMTKFNELPQIFNILLGDMTLVGPRPLMEAGFNRYAEKYQKNVYNMKPGLTGIGSIVFRDEELIITKSNLDPHTCYKEIILPFKGELELWYQKHASMLTDLKIIFLTAWAIVFPSSNLADRILPNLPERPDNLKAIENLGLSKSN